MLYMGIDVGSSGCKVSVVDDAGKLKYSAQQQYSFIYNGEFSEIDPNIVFTSVVDAICDITKKVKLDIF